MGFPRQEYWSELSFLNPGDFPHPGMEHTSLEYPALTGRFFTTLPPGKPSLSYTLRIVTAKEYEHFTAYILLYNDKLCYRVTTLIYTHTMNDWEDPLPPVSDLLNNLFHLHSLNNPMKILSSLFYRWEDRGREGLITTQAMLANGAAIIWV